LVLILQDNFGNICYENLLENKESDFQNRPLQSDDEQRQSSHPAYEPEPPLLVVFPIFKENDFINKYQEKHGTR
jgi:hypothetical protein